MSELKSAKVESRARRPLFLAIALVFASSTVHGATLNVVDGGDGATPAACTLREAIESIGAGSASGACANYVTGTFGSNDTIVFDNALVGATISLAQGELEVTATMKIQGSGQTIDAQGNSRVMYVSAGDLVASNLTISGGTTSAGYNGGGIYAAHSSVTLTDTTVTRNYADSHGGGISIYDGTLTLSNSTVTGNSTMLGGGGVYVSAGTANLGNVTITDNHANYGAGLACYGGTDPASISLSNVTVSGNGASDHSGGINGYNHATITLANSIVSANTAPANPDLHLTKISTASSDHSLLGSALQASFTGNGNVFADDPGVQTLADNGGPTQTMALRANSPAVDAGSNALIPGGVQTDQRGSGFPRIDGGTVDMGAFEFQNDIIFANGFEP